MNADFPADDASGSFGNIPMDSLGGWDSVDACRTGVGPVGGRTFFNGLLTFPGISFW